MKVCPLSVPWHPLEPISSSPIGVYWDLVRQTLTSMQLSIDDRHRRPELAMAPWQAILPIGVEGTAAPQFKRLRRAWSDMIKGDSKPEERVRSLLHQSDRLFQRHGMRSMLRSWLGIGDVTRIGWPGWRPGEIAPLWTARLVDRPVHSDEHLMPGYVVSDGTRQRDGTIAFAGCATGGLGWVGRVHLPGTSYESEVAGLLQSLVAIREYGLGSVPVSDC